jgi:hypothetical protein
LSVVKRIFLLVLVAVLRTSTVCGAAPRPVADDAGLNRLYQAARPGSSAPAVLSRDAPFARAAADIMEHYTFHRDLFLKQTKADTYPDAAGRRLVRAVNEMAAVADGPSPAERKFLRELGRRQAHELISNGALNLRLKQLASMSEEGNTRRRLPLNPLGEGEFWDMASGLDADRFILRELEPGTHYTFFDRSPYVVSVLRHVAELSGASFQVSVVEKNILDLRLPRRPLAVLRNKNAGAYVDGFPQKLELMTNWIKKGGKLVFQNDPWYLGRNKFIEWHGALALRLLREGWEMATSFAVSPAAEHDLDTVSLIRPADRPVLRTEAQA